MITLRTRKQIHLWNAELYHNDQGLVCADYLAMSTPRYVKVTSKNVLLPSGDPQPATVTVDRTTGKIVSIDLYYPGKNTEKHDSNIEVLDVGEKHVLPGLVE